MHTRYTRNETNNKRNFNVSFGSIEFPFHIMIEIYGELEQVLFGTYFRIFSEKQAAD